MGAFLRRTPAERAAIIRALPTLARVELGLRRNVSLPELASRLGIRLGTDPVGPPRRGAPLTARERLDADAARRVVRRFPAEARCLRRALLIGHALRARDPVLRIGAAKHDGQIHAHAWIEVGGQVPENTEHGVTFLPLRRSSGS